MALSTPLPFRDTIPFLPPAALYVGDMPAPRISGIGLGWLSMMMLSAFGRMRSVSSSSKLAHFAISINSPVLSAVYSLLQGIQGTRKENSRSAWY